MIITIFVITIITCVLVYCAYDRHNKIIKLFNQYNIQFDNILDEFMKNTKEYEKQIKKYESRSYYYKFKHYFKYCQDIITAKEQLRYLDKEISGFDTRYANIPLIILINILFFILIILYCNFGKNIFGEIDYFTVYCLLIFLYLFLPFLICNLLYSILLEKLKINTCIKSIKNVYSIDICDISMFANKIKKIGK